VHNLESEIIQCPYCGESIEVLVDCSIDDQEYIEDCSVCCSPIIFSVTAAEGEVVSIHVRSEDE
jgi:Cysteine-rich CPXCG